METRQMTLFSSSTFPTLTVCNKHSFLNLRILKIHFRVVPPLAYPSM